MKKRQQLQINLQKAKQLAFFGMRVKRWGGKTKLNMKRSPYSFDWF